MPTDGYEYVLNVYENYNSEENLYQTLYFYISPSSLFSYAFIAIPEFSGSSVEIEWSSSGLTVGAIIGIVAAIIVVVFIVTFIFIRKRRIAHAQTVIAPPVQQTDIPPVQPAYAQNVAKNYPPTSPQVVPNQSYY